MGHNRLVEDHFEPGYISLQRSGELQRRADRLWARLEHCDLCPHRCGINRLNRELGFCRAEELTGIASFCAHRGEEPALSGSRGSGTIFFGGCNMRCVYCQNYQISQAANPPGPAGDSAAELADKMLFLQNELRCHNINLVSPSHYVPQIVRALALAIPRGLKLPLVYNSGGYDAPDTLRELDGIVDIYLPDIRYSTDEAARRYSGVQDYVRYNREALEEMYRQVGNLVTDAEGIARRGLIIRHLILPEGLAGSGRSLRWIARRLSRETALSVMSQYYPCHRAEQFPELNRRITYAEYQRVVEVMEEEGLENGWLQEMDAPDNYRPDFEREGHPFE